MPVLKDIARKYELDTYPLRQALRRADLEPKNRRWKWDSETDPNYVSACEVAAKLKMKQRQRSRDYGGA